MSPPDKLRNSTSERRLAHPRVHTGGRYIGVELCRCSWLPALLLIWTPRVDSKQPTSNAGDVPLKAAMYAYKGSVVRRLCNHSGINSG
jgi:hypothetical protein